LGDPFGPRLGLTFGGCGVRLCFALGGDGPLTGRLSDLLGTGLGLTLGGGHPLASLSIGSGGPFLRRLGDLLCAGLGLLGDPFRPCLGLTRRLRFSSGGEGGSLGLGATLEGLISRSFGGDSTCLGAGSGGDGVRRGPLGDGDTLLSLLELLLDLARCRGASSRLAFSLRTCGLSLLGGEARGADGLVQTVDLASGLITPLSGNPLGAGFSLESGGLGHTKSLGGSLCTSLGLTLRGFSLGDATLGSLGLLGKLFGASSRLGHGLGSLFGELLGPLALLQRD
jgi:hypothetical protein